jgi:hypothetical protein
MRNSVTAALIAIWIVIIVIAYAFFFTISPPPAGTYDRLARCLAENDAIMYGQEGCHACEYQKTLLGSGYQYLRVVDCAQNQQICTNQMITGTPTWLINGSFYVGAQTPEQLSNESGCAI